MSGELVTVRLNKVAAAQWQHDGSLLQRLRDKGIDTTVMSCTEDGAELVYSSLPAKGATKGHPVTKANSEGGK